MFGVWDTGAYCCWHHNNIIPPAWYHQDTGLYVPKWTVESDDDENTIVNVIYIYIDSSGKESFFLNSALKAPRDDMGPAKVTLAGLTLSRNMGGWDEDLPKDLSS